MLFATTSFDGMTAVWASALGGTSWQTLVVAHVSKVVGRITLTTVILTKVGIHFSPHIPDFKGVEKGLSS